MNQELYTIYRYFSHHIRNCTALISTYLSMIESNLASTLKKDDDDDKDVLISDIIANTFLLDLFDIGMDRCFIFQFGKYQPSEGKFQAEAYVEHFLIRCENIMKERKISYTLNIHGAQDFMCDTFSVRALLELIIYEVILQTSSEFNVDVNEKSVEISIEDSFTPPEIWKIFTDILSVNNIALKIYNRKCILEYAA